MSLDHLDTYEKMAYNAVIELFNQSKQPIIAKQIFEEMKTKRYPKSLRTFRKIIGDLHKQGLIQERIVSTGKYKGKMGYVPLEIEPQTTQEGEKGKIVPEWKIEFLIKILKDNKMPKSIRELTSYRLRDCCDYNSSISSKGKRLLKNFFSELLDEVNHADESYNQLFVVFEEFIRFHMSDELDFVLTTYYKQLFNRFKTETNYELRCKVLRCLGQILTMCQGQGITKAKELNELFVNVFFDPNSGEKIADVAFENLRLRDEETIREFVKRIYEKMESGNEEIKKRCIKYLEQKILPIL